MIHEDVRSKISAIEALLRAGSYTDGTLNDIRELVLQCRMIGDQRLLADSLLALAGLFFLRSKLDESTEYIREALTLVDGTGTDTEVNALVLLGRTLLRTDLPLAKETLMKAYEVSSAINTAAAPHVLLRYGEVLGMTGSLPEGVALIKQAIDAYERREDAHGRLVALLRLCVLLQGADKSVACLEYATEALHLAQQHANPTARLNALKFLAGSLTALGRFDEAFDIGRRALELATMRNDPIAEADCLGTLGMSFFQAGDLTSALSVTQQAFHKYSHAGAILGEALCQMYAARIYAAAGDLQQAEQLIDHALETTQSAGNVYLTHQALKIRARIYQDLNRSNDAAALLSSLPTLELDDVANAEAAPVIEHALDTYRSFTVSAPLPSFGSLPEHVSLFPVLRPRPSQHSVRPFGVVLLGGFRLVRSGVEVPLDEWKRRKARDVFKFLVLRHRQSVSVDTIVEHLWSADAAVDSCLPTLQNAISIIRSILEPTLKPRQPSRFISHLDGAYVLDLGLDSLVDVEQFRALVAASRSCERPQDRRRLLEQATALYAGPLLPEDAFEEWTSFPRSDFHALCVEAYDALASVCFDLGDRPAATAAMRAAAALDDGE